MKTMKDWHGDFNDCVKPGEEVDEELYYYMLEQLPPIYPKPGIFQVSEPDTHGADGLPRYATFETKGGRYYYRGSLSTKQAREL